MSVDLDDLNGMSDGMAFTIDDLYGIKAIWDNYFPGDKKIDIHLREKISNIAIAAIVGLGIAVFAYISLELTVLAAVSAGIMGFAATLISKSIYIKIFGLANSTHKIMLEQRKIKEFLRKFCTDHSYSDIASEEELEVVRRPAKKTDPHLSASERSFSKKLHYQRSPERENNFDDGEPTLEVPPSPPDVKNLPLVSSFQDIEPLNS